MFRSFPIGKSFIGGHDVKSGNNLRNGTGTVTWVQLNNIFPALCSILIAHRIANESHYRTESMFVSRHRMRRAGVTGLSTGMLTAQKTRDR